MWKKTTVESLHLLLQQDLEVHSEKTRLVWKER